MRIDRAMEDEGIGRIEGVEGGTRLPMVVVDPRLHLEPRLVRELPDPGRVEARSDGVGLHPEVTARILRRRADEHGRALGKLAVKVIRVEEAVEVERVVLAERP